MTETPSIPLVDPATAIDKSSPVRTLVRADFQAQIDAAIQKLKPGSHFGVVVYGDDKTGLYGAAVARGHATGGEWSVSVATRWWGNEKAVYGEVMFQC